MSRHQEGEHLRTGDDLSAGQAAIIQAALNDTSMDANSALRA